jgi:hypothetical protein
MEPGRSVRIHTHFGSEKGDPARGGRNAGAQPTPMARKNHQPGPVPPDNRPHAGPDFDPTKTEDDADAPAGTSEGAAFTEQDPKRRLGGYETAGEHSIVQPGGKNDAQKDRG